MQWPVVKAKTARPPAKARPMANRRRGSNLRRNRSAAVNARGMSGTALQMIAFQRGDACGIVAAIFQAFERIHNLVRNRTASQNSDNAAHADQYLQIGENRQKVPGPLSENRAGADTQ